MTAELLQFVAGYCRVDIARLTHETRLQHDLGLDGDDAAEFMLAFSARFGVDLAGFDFGRYFGPEAAWNPLLYLYWRLFRPYKLHFDPLPVGLLVSAAQMGAWPEIKTGAE